MDIKEFIETTIIQIVEGIQSANSNIKDSEASVSQKDVRPLGGNGSTYNYYTGDLVNLIEFDVAITISEKDSGNGGAGIKIAGISIGGQLQNETANQSVSRIKFSLPLSFK